MRVLVGETTGTNAVAIQRMGWGRMWIARGRNIYTYPGEPWGLDNGAFRDWVGGKPFDADQYLAALDKALAQPEAPYLAVVPDAPGRARETMEMFERWRPRLPKFPWYIAVQDGMEPKDIAGYPIAGVFLGGTNAFKARAGEWCGWAHDQGLRFHYGRCGTMSKLAHAIHVGADSVDSAFPMWTKERWALFRNAVENGPPQQDLFFSRG